MVSHHRLVLTSLFLAAAAVLFLISEVFDFDATHQPAARATATTTTTGKAQRVGAPPDGAAEGSPLREVTLVTGANRGIGYGIAEALCAQRLAVLGTVRSEGKCAELVASLKRTYPECDASAAVLDMRSNATVGDTLDALERVLRRDRLVVTHAVLNAAINPPEPWRAADIEDFVQVNYYSTGLVVERLMTWLPASGVPGHIAVVLSNYAQLKHLKGRWLRKMLQDARDDGAVHAAAQQYLGVARRSTKEALKLAYPYAASKNLAAAMVRVRGGGGEGGGAGRSAVYVNGVHPGSVRTQMNPRGKLQPRDAAQHIVHVLRSVNESGSLYTMGRKMKW